MIIKKEGVFYKVKRRLSTVKIEKKLKEGESKQIPSPLSYLSLSES
jgi:hypothetical protein